MGGGEVAGLQGKGNYLVALAEHVGSERLLGKHAELVKVGLLLGRHLGGIGLWLWQTCNFSQFDV